MNTGSDLLPDFVSEVIRLYCSKDIIRTTSREGITLFVVSAFERKEEAEELEALIRDAGLESVSVSELEQ